MIPRAPVVADACVAVDDQRVDAKLLQARGNRETGLSAADNEHGGIAVGVRASVCRSIASIAGRPDMVWMFHVNASTSRQRPSVANSSAAIAASCACNAV